MRFMRASDSTISRCLPVGTDAPERPVLPPCGTIAMPASAHRRTTADTSAVVAGRTTPRAAPQYCLRQSVV